MKRATLLIIILGLMALSHRAEGSELTILYSNDVLGEIEPCPT